jgi:hypothetical protein
MSEHAADVVLKIGGASSLRRIIYARTAELSQQAEGKPNVAKSIALEDDNGGIEVIEYNEVESVMSKEVSEEVIVKFAKAIELTYGSAPADAMRTARTMVVDQELMAKVLPRIARNIEGAAKMVNRSRDVEKAGDFDSAVAAIRKRDKCSGVIAMRKAREEHPALFEALQTV